MSEVIWPVLLLLRSMKTRPRLFHNKIERLGLVIKKKERKKTSQGSLAQLLLLYERKTAPLAIITQLSLKHRPQRCDNIHDNR